MAIKPINASARYTSTWSAAEWHARNEMATAAAVRMYHETVSLYVDTTLPHRRLASKTGYDTVLVGMCKLNVPGEYSVNALQQVQDEMIITPLATIKRSGVTSFELHTLKGNQTGRMNFTCANLHDCMTRVTMLINTGYSLLKL